MMNEKASNPDKMEMTSLIAEQAMRCCEGFVSVDSIRQKEHRNVFGRPLITNSSVDLSFVQGLTLSGLRSCGIISTSSVKGIKETINSASRQHLPLVLHDISTSFSQNLKSEAIIWVNSSTAQETIDFTIIAHRISELSLQPCVHKISHMDSYQDLKFLSDQELIQFLGSPDDIIETPTPAQKIVFGTKRRRLPHYFSLDQPVEISPLKDVSEQALEIAANQQYFTHHNRELVQQVFEEFAAITGRSYNLLLTHNLHKSEYLLISEGGLFYQLKSFLEENKKLSIGLIEPTVFYEGANLPISDLLIKKKGITVLNVLEQPENSFGILISAAARELGVSNICIGKYADQPNIPEIELVCANMLSSNPKTDFYLGIAFNKTSEFPKHQILNEQISRAYPQLSNASISTDDSRSEQAAGWVDDSRKLPLAVLEYKDGGAPYTQLNRFYNDIGEFYQHDRSDELAADPFQALPMVPPLTSVFSNINSQREVLPVFVSENCTGCGECFVHCPHSAIPPIAIGIDSLLQVGMSIANDRGAQLTAIIPMLKNLAKTAGSAIKNSQTSIQVVGDFLEVAFNNLVEQMKVEGEKKETLTQEFTLLLTQIKELPVAVTDQFFSNQELLDSGSGELFSLAIDTSSCTGCGICSTVCPENALIMEDEHTSLVTELDQNLHLWEQLPDTKSYTVNRLIEAENYNSFAAIMLSRSIYLSMTGAGMEDADIFPKTMFHLVSSVAESIMQPRYAVQVDSINSLIQELEANIHNSLSDSIPKEHFEGLQKALSNTNGTIAPFEEIISKIGGQERLKQVNTDDVSRKLSLLNDLKTLFWLITKGPTGTGRSRFSQAFNDNGLNWANKYPFNSFTAPTVVQWSSSLPHLSLGLVQGQLRYLLDNLKLLRRAQLEAKSKYVPAKHDLEIANLDWGQLTAEEKGLIPPLFIVGEENLLTSGMWTDLSRLMQMDIPIKIIILDSMTVKVGDTQKIARSHAELVSLMALKSSYVFQGSLGDSPAMFEGLVKGLSNSDSAFIKLLAPDSKNFVNDNYRLNDLSAIAN